MVVVGLTQDVQELRGFVTTRVPLKARVNPLVPISILDAFARNEEKKVVGTLLGYQSEGNIIEIVDCYTVAHSETKDEEDQRTVLLDQDYHRKMAGLKSQVHGKETVVGWFSCDGKSVETFDEATVQVHAFYSSKSQSLFNSNIGLSSPLHLVMNTKNAHLGDINCKVYMTYQTGGLEKLHQFHEVALAESSFVQDKDICSMILASREGADGSLEDGESKKEVQSMDMFVKNLEQLEELLTQAKAYTARVLKGEEEGKSEVGRAISGCLTATEDSTEAASESSAMKDSLMVMYLSNLAKTQITLAEKLNAALAKQALAQEGA